MAQTPELHKEMEGVLFDHPIRVKKDTLYI